MDTAITTKTKSARVVFSILFGSGVIDIILRYLYINDMEMTAITVLLDPAKTMMHLFLLPIAGYVVVLRFPVTYFRGLYSRNGISNNLYNFSFSAVIAIFLGCAAIYIIVNDPQKGFCERWPAPTDVSDPDFRDQMIKERKTWYKDLRSKSEVLGKNSPNYKKYKLIVNKIQTKNCNFWTDASIRAYWAVFLTFQAIFVIGVFFWICLSYFFSRPVVHPPEAEWIGLVLIVIVLTPWIAFRPLSEWIINFGVFDETTYGPLLMSVVFVFVAVGVLIALRPSMPAIWVLAAVLTGGSLVITTVAAISPEAFSSLSRAFAQQELGLLIIEYGIISFFIIGMVSRITSANSQNPGTSQMN